MSSICSWPDSGCLRFEGIVIGGEGDGGELHGLVVVSCSCWRWVYFLRFPWFWDGAVFRGVLESTCGVNWNPGRSSCFVLVLWSVDEHRE